MSIPKSLQPILWSKDISHLDVTKDQDYIVHQVLSRGTLRDVCWLAKTYGQKTILGVVVNSPKKYLQT